MRVGLVAVGTELLAGVVTNANAAWLGRTFTEAGFDVTRSVAVGDDVDEIARTVCDELVVADAVVLTGGLGPTSDDRTREALAVAAGVPLQRDRDLADRLESWYAERGRQVPDAARRQADLPQGAVPLENPRGSALGVRVDTDQGVVFALPGVPREMTEMVADSVLPTLRTLAGPGAGAVTRTLRTAGAGESRVATLLGPLEEDLARDGRDRPEVAVAYLAAAGEVRVQLTARGPDRDVLDRVLDDVTGRARDLLGDLVYGEGEETLDVTVHRLLASRGATVAVAESLTGGLLGAALTDMPGSSATFRGGVTAYVTDLKTPLLGVREDLLDRHGPVHPDVAVGMADGVRGRLQATYGVATTGVAGPDPEGVPVGTVHVAVAGPEGTRAWPCRLHGDRDAIRRRTVVTALDLLRRTVLGLPDPTDRESAA
ncbi:MAG: CinA family nicotinamide mononucleotide deamidase-related protein [Actinomycetes bacterium]